MSTVDEEIKVAVKAQVEVRKERGLGKGYLRQLTLSLCLMFIKRREPNKYFCVMSNDAQAAIRTEC